MFDVLYIYIYIYGLYIVIHVCVCVCVCVCVAGAAALRVLRAAPRGTQWFVVLFVVAVLFRHRSHLSLIKTSLVRTEPRAPCPQSVDFKHKSNNNDNNNNK